MAKVSLESSYTLSALGRSIGEIRQSMEDDLKALNGAFERACERWKDKNASDCADALREHHAAMQSALNRLADIESGVARLAELANMYENI